MNYSPSSKTGFSLVEVLVALAVISTCLVVILNSQVLSIEGGIRSQHYTKAVFLAQEILIETQMEENLSVEYEEGKFEDSPDFRWEREVSEAGIEEVEGLKKVKIKVLGPENTQIILHTYYLGNS